MAIAVLPSQRRPMGWAALIATFTAPYNYFFVPEYWDPVIMGPLKFGPADVIFLVAHGGLGWLGIPAVYGRAGLRVPAFGMKSANPGFVRAWNPAALSGFQFLGAPAEEIAWGVAFGAVWPLFVAYVFGVERICGSEAAGSSRI